MNPNERWLALHASKYAKDRTMDQPDKKIDEAIDELKTAEKACADSYAYGNIVYARELLESAKAEHIDYSKCQYCGASRIVRTSGKWQYSCKCDEPQNRPAKAEQPPEVEFTKECRELIIGDDTKNKKGWTNEKGYLVWLEVRLSQACDRLDAQQQEIEEMTESAGFWGRSCARLWKKIDAQRQEIEKLKAELYGEKACYEGKKKVASDLANNYEKVQNEVDRLTAENTELREAHRQYCNTINRMDVNAEQMDKNYGQMVLERDALRAENKALKESHELLETKRKTLTERIEKLEDALQDINEYWNRSENDRAMNDALYHMIGVAEQALQQQEGKTENPGQTGMKGTKNRTCRICNQSYRSWCLYLRQML